MFGQYELSFRNLLLNFYLKLLDFEHKSKSAADIKYKSI